MERLRLQYTLKSLLADRGRRPFASLYPLRRNSPAVTGTIFYEAHLFRQLEDVLSDGLHRFDGSHDLPQRYGIGLAERAVEIPWFMARVGGAPGLHLDAGSSLNFELVLRHEKLARKRLVIANINPERNCYWTSGVSYVFLDLRTPFFVDDLFDSVSCISVLEHVGLNNDRYTEDRRFHEHAPEGHLVAVKELRRILKPDGECFVTLPYGSHVDHGWLQVFDRKMVSRVIDEFEPTSSDISYFTYRRDGWRTAEEAECRDSRYATSYPGDIQQVGAQSVVCIRLVK